MNCVMKYLLTIFAAAMLCLSASAQDHLCFEGIPIEGPVSSFVDKLKEAGFKEWEDDIARTLLKGKLFGRECTLIVKSNPDNGDVYAVKATFAINKAANPMTVKAKTATLKAKVLKKKAQTLAVGKVMKKSGAQGRLTYKLVGVKKAKFKKFFKINAKNGKITVKKKLKKGKNNMKIILNY